MKSLLSYFPFKYRFFFLLLAFPLVAEAQSGYDGLIKQHFRETLRLHKELVSIPNLPSNPELMLKNINWVAARYKALGFETELLESESLPLLLAEKTYNPKFKTILFYFHIDGQPVNPEAWEQPDPFVPVLKERSGIGEWKAIDWARLEGEINDDWRIYARAAADDKAPILMFLTALKILQSEGKNPNVNIKVIFDPEEEYGSEALLGTLDQYKNRYASDYFLVMDGPAHDSNKPTLTFGCRGIASCEITTFGAELPQHSGHFGNYAPNPVFGLAQLLANMKDEHGRVLIDDYYQGVELDGATRKLLQSVPYDATEFNNKLKIHAAEKVGRNYQESLQFPSLNVRQIATSWKGEKLKTIIPETATAYLDIRLVPEIDGATQLERIRQHLRKEGYFLLDRDPTDEERLAHPKIVKFIADAGINAFRTNPESDFAKMIRNNLSKQFGYEPITIRMMGGTVPIVPLINALKVPTIIVPMVNMDNNQHNPNENIRIGNIRDGIKTCLSILEASL